MIVNHIPAPNKNAWVVILCIRRKGTVLLKSCKKSKADDKHVFRMFRVTVHSNKSK